MAVTIKKIVLWRKEVENRPGALASLARAGADLQVVEGVNRPGLGHAISQARADAGISIDFLVGQVVGRKYSAAFGFDSEADATEAVTLIRKAAAVKKEVNNAMRSLTCLSAEEVAQVAILRFCHSLIV